MTTAHTTPTPATTTSTAAPVPAATPAARALRAVLHLDAAGCGLMGLAGLLVAAPVAAAAGLSATWPVLALGAALLVYAAENVLIVRRPTPARVTALVAVDVTFGVAALAAAASLPTASGVVRAGAVLFGLVSLSMAAAKTWAR